MKIRKADTEYRFLYRPVIISEVRPLPESIPLPGAFQPGSTVYVSPKLLAPGTLEPRDKPPSSGAPGEAKERIKLADMIKNLAAGAALATPPLRVVQLTHTTTHADLMSLLTGNNVYNLPRTQAEPVAETVLGFIKTNAGRSVFIGLAAGGVTLGILDAFTPRWGWPLKLTLAGAVAALASLLFYLLLQRG